LNGNSLNDKVGNAHLFFEIISVVLIYFSGSIVENSQNPVEN
jgi:hypothetical protein